MSAPTPGTPGPKPERSLIQLLTELPRLIVANVKAELAVLKAELAAKAALIGVGIALLITAFVLLFFFLGTLFTAAIDGLATVWPRWLADLTVAGGILVVILILVGIGIAQFKAVGKVGRKATPPTRDEEDGR